MYSKCVAQSKCLINCYLYHSCSVFCKRVKQIKTIFFYLLSYFFLVLTSVLVPLCPAYHFQLPAVVAIGHTCPVERALCLSNRRHLIDAYWLRQRSRFHGPDVTGVSLSWGSQPARSQVEMVWGGDGVGFICCQEQHTSRESQEIAPVPGLYQAKECPVTGVKDKKSQSQGSGNPWECMSMRERESSSNHICPGW